MRILLLVLLLAAPALAQGMFDLFPGTWTREGQGLVGIEVGDPEGKRMLLTCRGPEGEARVAGRYQVTATKGDPHVRFDVESGQAELPGLSLRPGGSARFIFHYGEAGALTVNAFEPETLALAFTVELREVER